MSERARPSSADTARDVVERSKPPSAATRLELEKNWENAYQENAYQKVLQEVQSAKRKADADAWAEELGLPGYVAKRQSRKEGNPIIE